MGFIRNLVKTGRGGSDTIWTLAAAACGAGLPWFAGPLALFAAGYYADFIHVMATAAYLGQPLAPTQRVLNRQRLLELILAVEGATLPSEPSEREIEAKAIYEQRIRRGDSKRRIGSARNRLAEAEKERRDAWRAGHEPAERTAWRCSPAEHAISDAARLQATNPFAGNSLVVAATLADAHPEIELQAQQGVVVHALEAWLSYEVSVFKERHRPCVSTLLGPVGRRLYIDGAALNSLARRRKICRSVQHILRFSSIASVQRAPKTGRIP